MTIPQDFSLDGRLVRQRAERSAITADEAGFLSREIAQRMAERLSYIRYEPSVVLDLGCGTGPDFGALAERYPQATRLGIDFAHPRLRLAAGQRGFFQRLLGSPRRAGPQLACADANALPLRHGSVGMIWSNLMLNWLADPMPAIREMHRCLEVGGLLMFATLGPDTLKELRGAMPTGPGERVHRFIDMHDLGDCLIGAGFAEPVMDMETLTLTYHGLDDLLRDLRRAGASNAAEARPRGLCGRQGWTAARSAYERLRQDGRLPASVEIIYGHAWKATPRKTAEGHDIVRFAPPN